MLQNQKKKKIAVLYLKWITNKDLLNSKWNSAQCYVAAGMGGVFGGEWIHVSEKAMAPYPSTLA